MRRHERQVDGFTLVELMVVVMIVGILVTIAVPIYQEARAAASASACQANQRTIMGAVAMARTSDVDVSGATAGQLRPGGCNWQSILVPDWLRYAPTCPIGRDSYSLDVEGDITGDMGATTDFKDGHRVQ